MGFDGFDPIEVVMDVEDTFAITIPNSDAERITSAGALCDYVLARVQVARPRTGATCLSAASFYRMRRRLAEAYGVNPAQVGPQTHLRQILPAETFRWDGWRELGNTLGVKLRPLQHPRWLALIAFCLGLCFYSLTLVVVFSRRGSPWAIACGIPACLTAFFLPWRLLLRLTRQRFAVHIPRGYETVGQVSSLLMHEAFEAAVKRKKEWTAHEVWEFVRCSIAKSAGIPPAQVQKESRFLQGDLI
jgi:hypothetical protein